MKTLFVISLVCLAVVASHAQYVTQTASGKGAILLPLNGAAVEFDIGKTEAGIALNNYGKAMASDNNKPFRNWFFGGSLNAGNSEGIGNLFETGSIVPAAGVLGFLGFSINNNLRITEKWKGSRVSLMADQEQAQLHLRYRAYRDTVYYTMLTALKLANDDEKVRNGDLLLGLIGKSPDNRRMTILVDSIYKINNAKMAPVIREFRDLLEPATKRYVDGLVRPHMNHAINSALNEFMNENRVVRLTAFLFGGVDARGFSLFNGIMTPDLSASFTDTIQRGGSFGAGFNAQYGTVWVGATYSYVSGDNYSALSGKEYQLRSTNSSNSQTLTSSRTIFAYSGDYRRLKSNLLHVDLVKEFGLGDTSRLISDLYYHGSLFSRDQNYLANTSDIGLGLYFLGNKSKFIGGLYVELRDINNNREKLKPVAERETGSPFRRLSFGIVTKFALGSLFAFANRPRPE